MVRTSIALVAALAASGCATLSQFTALQRVDFSLEGASQVRLAGVDLSRVQSFGDLSFSEAASLATAVSNRELPLTLQLDVLAENPADNVADARLVQLDWTFFIEGRETVGGRVDDETMLRRGQPTPIPVAVSLNLVEFFEGSARDLFELAQSLAGVGGTPKELAVEALPVVQTAIGPISYPSPVRIATTVGDD